MRKSFYLKILSKLKDPDLKEEFKLSVPLCLTRLQCKKLYRDRTLAADRTGIKVEALYPNEHFSPQDIAFGLLSNQQFVSALDFETTDIEKGYVSHSSMLVGLGYAKDENDPNPKYDYVVRGIVKASLNRNIIFWETPEQLLDSPQLFKAFQRCCRYLKSKGLAQRNTRVFGAGSDRALGEIENFL
jgi:hypothetical protein